MRIFSDKLIGIAKFRMDSQLSTDDVAIFTSFRKKEWLIFYQASVSGITTCCEELTERSCQE